MKVAGITYKTSDDRRKFVVSFDQGLTTREPFEVSLIRPYGYKCDDDSELLRLVLTMTQCQVIYAGATAFVQAHSIEFQIPECDQDPATNRFQYAIQTSIHSGLFTHGYSVSPGGSGSIMGASAPLPLPPGSTQ
jgi:hypothetical protein